MVMSLLIGSAEILIGGDEGNKGGKERASPKAFFSQGDDSPYPSTLSVTQFIIPRDNSPSSLLLRTYTACVMCANVPKLW